MHKGLNDMDFDSFKDQLRQVVTGDADLNSLSFETLLEAIPRVDCLVDVLPGATVLVRADIDIPIKDGQVMDMSRIEADSETIRYCHEKGWKTVIFGHIGREKSKSTAPACKAMSDYLGLQIDFVEDWLDEENNRLLGEFAQRVQDARPGDLSMLQNARKYDIERGLWEVDDSSFSETSRNMYAVCRDIRDRLSTVEINEAIAASNIDFSSSVIPLAMSKTAMGFYIAKEMSTHIRGARRSNLVVFSGLKINKLDDLEGVLDRGQLVMIIAAGSLAMALLKARAQLDGLDFFIGLAETDPSQKAYIAPKRIEQAKRIVQKCANQRVNLVLPTDFVLDSGQISRMIPGGHAQMDIGPETRALFEQRVEDYIQASRNACEPYTMFFNGVLGKFEDARFEEGTKSFIPLLGRMTQAGVATYVGGGEGRLALKKYGSLDDVTHAFTCGGTVLKSLSDKHIAYLKAMYLQNTGSTSQERTLQMKLGVETADLIAEFESCQDSQRLEGLADRLGETGDALAIEPLLYRLGDCRVQEDQDVEDAVCGALVKHGVMQRLGNLNFRFLDESSLSTDVLDLLKKHKELIPSKYRQEQT